MKTIKAILKFILYGTELKTGNKYVILHSNILKKQIMVKVIISGNCYSVYSPDGEVIAAAIFLEDGETQESLESYWNEYEQEVIKTN